MHVQVKKLVTALPCNPEYPQSVAKVKPTATLSSSSDDVVLLVVVAAPPRPKTSVAEHWRYICCLLGRLEGIDSESDFLSSKFTPVQASLLTLADERKTRTCLSMCVKEERGLDERKQERLFAIGRRGKDGKAFGERNDFRMLLLGHAKKMKVHRQF